MALGFVNAGLVRDVGQALGGWDRVGNALQGWNRFAEANDLPTTQDMGVAAARGAVGAARRAPGVLAAMAERNAAYQNTRETQWRAYLEGEKAKAAGATKAEQRAVVTAVKRAAAAPKKRGGGGTTSRRSNASRFVRAGTLG